MRVRSTYLDANYMIILIINSSIAVLFNGFAHAFEDHFISFYFTEGIGHNHLLITKLYFSTLKNGLKILRN